MKVLFGTCVLDSESRRLLCGGEALHVSPKAFQLLHLLLEARPRALSKADLRARLWPGTFVLEANLPNLVSELREAIGDDARKPRFVRTVHGFGYAFCGVATELDAEDRAAFVYRLDGDVGRIVLREGDHLLGRDPRSAVWIDSPSVSRRHARLQINQGQAILEDLGSRNGTFLGGERLRAPAPLKDGDSFSLGSVCLTFRVLPMQEARETDQY